MRSLSFSCCVLASLFLQSQIDEDIEKLRPVSNPATSILELQPTVALNPKSKDALETALFSNFQQDGSPSLANDFSLEFTPYWFTDHGLLLEDYLFAKPWAQIIQNASFSIASSKNFVLGDSSFSEAIAFGFRSSMHIGNKSDRDNVITFKAGLNGVQAIKVEIVSKFEEIIESLEEANIDFRLALNKLEPTLIEQLLDGKLVGSRKEAEQVAMKAFDEVIKTSANDYYELADQLYPILDQIINRGQALSEFSDYLQDRDGLYLDFAYAALTNFPTNNFEKSYVTKQSFWLMPSYNFKKKIDFLALNGIARYNWYDIHYYSIYFPQSEVYQNNWDLGFSLNTNFKKLEAQIELVKRYSSSKIDLGENAEGMPIFTELSKKDFQYVGTISYRLNDQIVLNYSLGESFEPIFNPESTLVSVLGLNIGIGQQKAGD